MASSLYLVSSSATRKYVEDCLTALAMPRDVVHHFRYRLDLLQHKVAAAAKKGRPGRLPAGLPRTVVVVYAFSHRTPEEQWVPRPYLPLRYGSLVEAYCEGD